MFPLARAILCLLSSAGCAAAGEVALELQDVICVPGHRGLLVADVAKSITLSLKDPKRAVTVEFLADGQSLGSAITNARGRATLSVNRAGRPGGYSARATCDGRELTARGRWFQWHMTRTIVAVDIDDTVCWTNYGDLFISPRDHVSKPIDGAATALNRLSKQFYILYLSARPAWLTDKTRAWLSDNGFPAGPVIHRGGWESCLRQRAVKEEILTDLRAYLPGLLIGIADREVDVRAFGSHKMVTMLVRNPQLAGSNSRVIGFHGWSELAGYVEKNEAGFADTATLTRAIASNSLPPAAPAPEGLSEATGGRSTPPDLATGVFH